jgi:phage shock protein E
MRLTHVLIPLALLAGIPAAAQAEAVPDNPAIDYPAYARLVGELGPVREERRLGWAEFARHAGARGALLLDARSESAFARGHIKGAVNLPFTDFTAESLKAVIGANPDRPIYIYCNNNFTNNRDPVKTKAAPLALNIQTFVNLYGYGYHNIWELADRIDFADPRYRWTRKRR